MTDLRLFEVSLSKTGPHDLWIAADLSYIYKSGIKEPMSELRKREDAPSSNPPTPQSRVQRPPRGDGDTVTVACNLPNGLILELFEMREEWEGAPNGGRMVPRSRPKEGAGRFVLKGNAINIEAVLKGQADLSTVNGYALTTGVPKEFWEEWLSQNADQPYVKNHCVFAYGTSEAGTRDKAKEMKGQLSGFEPINPADPASKSPELRGIQRGTTTDNP